MNPLPSELILLIMSFQIDWKRPSRSIQQVCCLEALSKEFVSQEFVSCFLNKYWLQVLAQICHHSETFIPIQSGITSIGSKHFLCKLMQALDVKNFKDEVKISHFENESAVLTLGGECFSVLILTP